MWVKAKSPVGLVNLAHATRVFVREFDGKAALYAEMVNGRYVKLAEHEDAEVLRLAQDRIEDRLVALSAVFDVHHFVEIGYAAPLAALEVGG